MTQTSPHVPFSVLMSVYAKEKPENLALALESVCDSSCMPDEVVLVEDGPLTEGLYAAIDAFESGYPGLLRTVPLEKNAGLGPALARGIPACRNELIARMDSDDVSMPGRFAAQIACFEADPTIDICGGYIKEFEDEPGNDVSVRTVPLSHEEIVKYQHRRDAFNHMTVMYRKKAVLAAGNYGDVPLMEDTLLWVKMIQSGARCMNIPDTLVDVRIGEGMYERRGGVSYFKKYRSARRRVLDTGFISYGDYFITVAAQLVVALMPSRLRGLVFKRALHGRAA